MRFSLLGPLRVEHDGVHLNIRGNKLQTVLTALLLARSNVVSADRLVELIWADEPPQKPYVAVRSYISHLRRDMEPDSKAGGRNTRLVTKSPGYALQVDQDAVDAFRFEAAVTNIRQRMGGSPSSDLPGSGMGSPNEFVDLLAEVEAALALWRSDDLADSPLALFVGEADRLIELREEATAHRFDILLARGRHQETIPDLRSRLDVDQTNERYLSQLMLALHRSGRSAEAVQAYQTGLRTSVDNTGLDLSSALADLERKILNGDPTLDYDQPAHVTAAERPQPKPVRSATVPAAEPPEAPIGREAEAVVLAAAVNQPAGQLLVISGEPGIGKSEMMRFAATLAKTNTHAVAWGFGHSGSRSVPLAPWRALLHDLVAEVDDGQLRRLVGEQGPELAGLIPSIGVRLGIDPADSRDVQALNSSIGWFIRQIAHERPLIICLEDLHWVDDVSLGVLSYIVPTIADHPIAVITSWRDTEPYEDDQAVALAGLGRLAEGHRLEMAGLSNEAVGLIWQTSEQWDSEDPPAASNVAALQRRTAGNPLFVKELIRSSPNQNQLLPTATVTDVIVERLSSIPPEAKEILNIGALCPNGFSEGLLAELSGLAETPLLDNLELLLDAKLLTEDPLAADRFNFSHSLIGESLAARMSGVRKARLHTRIAAYLEREQATIGQLAHHLLQGATAGDPVAAAISALAAAQEAARLHDHGSAIDLIERGLAALDRADDDQLRAKLMVELAQERKHKQHFTQAHAAAQEAFRLAKRAGDIDLMVTAALAFCGQGKEDNRFGISWLGYWNPPGPALDLLRQCLEKLDSGPQRAVVLMAYASQLFGEFDDPKEAAIVLDEAVAEARQYPHGELLAGALNQQIFALQRHLPFERRKEIADELSALAEMTANPARLVAANRIQMVLCLDRSDTAGARAEFEAARATLVGKDEPGLSLFADSMDIALDLYQGRLDQAEMKIQSAMAVYEPIGSAALDLLGIQYATLLRERGQLAQVEELMRWKVSGYPGPAYGVALAMVLALQGKHHDARTALDDFGGSGIENGGEGVLQFMTPCFYAEALIALGDHERAARLYPALSGASKRVVTMYSGIVMFGSGSLYLGRLATMLGYYDEAAAHLEDAELQHTTSEAIPYLLRTVLAKRELANATQQAAEFDPLDIRARELATSVNMEWLYREASG